MERKRELWPVNYSEEKGPLYPRSGFEHACLASPANGPQIDMLPDSPHPLTQQLFLSSYTGSYQSSLAERVNNYFMTTLLCKLEGCLHKEKRVYFKRVMAYFKKMGELFMVACSDVFLPLCVGYIWG